MKFRFFIITAIVWLALFLTLYFADSITAYLEHCHYLKAELGSAVEQYNLGRAYHEGEGVAQDDAEAVKWTRKAAEQGDAFAQYNLGVAYHEGEGVARDDAEAVKWLRKAVEQANVLARYNLGVAYYKGDVAARDYVGEVKWGNRLFYRL